VIKRLVPGRDAEESKGGENDGVVSEGEGGQDAGNRGARMWVRPHVLV